jgi:hypothetical protein
MGMLVIFKDWGIYRVKRKRNGAKHRTNPRGKPSTRHWEMNLHFSRTIT